MKDVRVSQISCGDAHALVLTDTGHVYSWGDGAGGRLGHGDEKDLWEPRLCESISTGGSNTAALPAMII